MAGTSPDPLNNLPIIGACKPKKEEKSHWFDLKLTESNDEIYPEFSWLELIAAKNGKLAKEGISAGHSLLDPYASGDEDDLKAMAARFEAKYGHGQRTKSVKRRHQAEDYIDRGAGYDESDSFIDNSDVYDEVVPADLDTVRGGFYINEGTLEFRQVEMPDEEHIEEESNKQEEIVNSSVPVSAPSSIITAPASMPKQKRPKLIVTRQHSSLQSKMKVKNGIKVEKEKDKKSGNHGQKSRIHSTSVPDNGIPAVRWIRTKNVPPNPALLAKNKIIITSTPLGVVSRTKEIIVTTPIPSSKVLMQTTQNISPITRSSTALNLVRNNKLPKSSKQHHHPNPKNVNISLMAAQHGQAAAAALMLKAFGTTIILPLTLFHPGPS